MLRETVAGFSVPHGRGRPGAGGLQLTRVHVLSLREGGGCCNTVTNKS